jgi:hypothetical protein
VQQDVIESLAPTLRRVARYLKVTSDMILSDVIIETTRTERDNKGLLILQRVGLGDSGRGSFDDGPPRLDLVVQIFGIP